jgi:hypothetical protein
LQRRKVTAAYEVVKDVIPVEDFLQCVNVSMTDLENNFSARAPHGKKAVWKQELENKLIDADCLTSGNPSVYLKQVKNK